ncbi:MAG: peptidylprolyl isomerase [Winogradskyella sp.]
MIKNKFTPLVAVLLLLVSSCKAQYPDLEDGIYAEFVTTKGTMVAKLFHKKVPVTVANFVALAEGKHPLAAEKYKGKPFYDGITFHRVMDKFMIQGGDPDATGMGSAGFKFEDEFNSDLKHDKPGILSMANSGPNSNGSQFFIMEVPWPSLDNRHAVFGELVKGIDIQDSISNVKVIDPKVRNHKPVEDVVITKLNIIRKGTEANNFDAPKVFEDELPKIKERAAAAKEAKRKKAEALAKQAQIDFLKKNEQLTGRRIESPTGMAMIFTHESNGVTPTAAQRVKIDCAGYLENGKLFWTTWKAVAEKNGMYDEQQDKRNGYAPFTMPYNKTASLVAGFREAMLNMKIGDKARVFIPHYLGYGANGRPPVIPGNANLIFDVQLTSIAE